MLTAKLIAARYDAVACSFVVQSGTCAGMYSGAGVHALDGVGLSAQKAVAMCGLS